MCNPSTPPASCRAPSYPILQFVVVSFRDRVGIGSTLAEAILDSSAATRRRRHPTTAASNPPPDDGGDNTKIPAKVRNLLAQAEDDFEAADARVRGGRRRRVGHADRGGAHKVDQALALLDAASRRADRRADDRAVAAICETSILVPPTDRVTLSSPTRGGAAR